MRLSFVCANFDAMLAGRPFSVVYVFTLHDGFPAVLDMMIAKKLIAKSILFIVHVIVSKFLHAKIVIISERCKFHKKIIMKHCILLFYSSLLLLTNSVGVMPYSALKFSVNRFGEL